MLRKFALLTLALLLSLALSGSGPALGLQNDPGLGDGGGGGGWTTYCDHTCARQCPNGYWSSIACLPNECAFCPCPPGGIPYPRCKVM